MLACRIDIDAELKLSEVNMNLIEELNRLEPFGLNNPYPVFMFKSLKIEKFSKIGQTGEHFKLKIRNSGSSFFDAVGWGMGDACDSLLKDSIFFDLAAQVGSNRWNNKESVQLSVVDLRPTI